MYVSEDNGRYRWLDNQHPYICQLASPKKETKLHGLKSYIAYQLTPSFNSIQVSRRYKHFDWLQARLEEKFITIPIPPLPDKQISGRYQEDFIRHRLQQVSIVSKILSINKYSVSFNSGSTVFAAILSFHKAKFGCTSLLALVSFPLFLKSYLLDRPIINRRKAMERWEKESGEG